MYILPPVSCSISGEVTLCLSTKNPHPLTQMQIFLYKEHWGMYFRYYDHHQRYYLKKIIINDHFLLLLINLKMLYNKLRGGDRK